MDKMDTDVEMAIAILHDVVEDTKFTLDALRVHGFPLELITAVDALTHRKDESYADYLGRVKTNLLATKVKLADLEDNMRVERLGGKYTEKDEKRMRKYRDAYNELLTHGYNLTPEEPPEDWNACKSSD